MESLGLEVNSEKTKIERQGICFRGITYTVTEGIFKRTKKRILKDVSGVMIPGLNAIMGPTGSGKTTLLDILADRRNKKGLEGMVLINGEHQPKDFKFMSGYVVQDDVVMGTLTVKENLYFSAALRLPTSVSWKEKKLRVKKVIDELGLNECANTKIGTEFTRGVSGGERKRTNIGMELIIEPDVLFLDEPTTGLDAFTAISVIQLLKNLSSNGDRNIIVSIHQPRYSIYKQFDTLTLLSHGEMVYYGTVNNTLDYFAKLGYHCEEHDNPADFVLDVINQCEGNKSAATNLLAIEQGDNNDVVDLSRAYKQSDERNAINAQCENIVANLNGKEDVGYKMRPVKAKYVTNPFWQLLIVGIRSLVNLARNPMTSVLQYIITVIFAIIVGGIYFDLDTGENGYQNRIGAIFFIVMNQVFSNLSAIDLFIRQKAIFIHENASGYYRVSTYFFAKVFADLISTRLIPLCLFSLITYFMIGFQIDAGRYFIFFLTLFLTSFAAIALAFWISAGVRVAGIGSLLVALSFVVQMLFGGFLLTLDSLPVWVRWLQYLSLFRYSIEALAVNEIEGLQFNETFNGIEVVVNGTDILEIQGFNTSWIWYDELGLFVMSILFLFLGYITLRLIKKEK